MLKSLLQLSEQLINPDTFLRKRYATFLRLLNTDRKCHLLLTSLEEVYYHEKRLDISHIRRLYNQLSGEVRTLIDCLHELAPGKYSNLNDYYKKFDFYARFALASPEASSNPPYIVSLDEVFTDDKVTGGKGLHLSQIHHSLNLPVPAGFIISTTAWNRFLQIHDLREPINRILERADPENEATLHRCSSEIIALLDSKELPQEIIDEVTDALQPLVSTMRDARFAVRSSAVGEDSMLSFAGQYNTLLNVSPQEVCSAYRQVLFSKYSPEAICYRIINGLDDEATPMAVLILTMVEAMYSGVVTSSSTADPGYQTIFVHSVKGLGDSLMGGQISPVTTRIKMGRGNTDIISCSDQQQPGAHLSETQLLQLAGWAEQIASFYQRPQEIEWCCDQHGMLYLLQTRQQSQTDELIVDSTTDISHLSKIYQGGKTASRGLCSGPVFPITPGGGTKDVPRGAILLCEVTPPSLVTVLPRISGVIAKYGSVADHFSSVAREFGVPVLVQLEENLELLKDKAELTLDTASQTIYSGAVAMKGTDKAKVQWQKGSPLFQTLKLLMGFVSPLNLLNPSGAEFTPENCRSLHDIIRFCHEKSVEAMFFHSTDSLLRKPSARLLRIKIPLQMYLVDVGGGISTSDAGKEKTVSPEDLNCVPLKSLLDGLGHPGVNWRDRAHFDWQSYDTVALAGGIGSKNDTALASYCLISGEYLNVNMRFGYHYALLDCLCGVTPEENYILLRFSGGGGTNTGKDHRLEFISLVLDRLGFESTITGDLLDAKFMRRSPGQIKGAMDMVGRLLGAVKLLDLVLGQDSDTEAMVERFFSGIYDFSKE